MAATARLEFCVRPGATTAKPALFLPSMPRAFFTIGSRRARTGTLCVAPAQIVGGRHRQAHALKVSGATGSGPIELKGSPKIGVSVGLVAPRVAAQGLSQQ
jgi:hypothetical protein